MKNYIGKKFNRLEAIEETKTIKLSGKNRRHFIFKCDCGNKIELPINRVTTGITKSCGCLKKEASLRNLERIKPKTQRDVIGETYGRLTIVDDVKSDGVRRIIADCSCGTKSKEYILSQLINGKTQSCGCLRKELMSKDVRDKDNISYIVWVNMRQRCYNKNSPNYKNYGERGIEVCERWIESFENFKEDMGGRISNNFTIERIDVNGNYEPGNCKWIKKKYQSRNTRRTKLNAEKVSFIKTYKNFRVTRKQLSLIFSCSEATISSVSENRSWKDVRPMDIETATAYYQAKIKPFI